MSNHLNTRAAHANSRPPALDPTQVASGGLSCKLSYSPGSEMFSCRRVSIISTAAGYGE